MGPKGIGSENAAFLSLFEEEDGVCEVIYGWMVLFSVSFFFNLQMAEK